MFFFSVPVIHFHVKCLKAVKIRVSIIGLSAEVRVCTVLARETGGMYVCSSNQIRFIICNLFDWKYMF